MIIFTVTVVVYEEKKYRTDHVKCIYRRPAQKLEQMMILPDRLKLVCCSKKFLKFHGASLFWSLKIG